MDFHQAILTKKGFLENNDVTLISEIKVITSERELAKTFNQHYIKLVEIVKCIIKIVKCYKNHIIILQIKNF